MFMLRLTGASDSCAIKGLVTFFLNNVSSISFFANSKENKFLNGSLQIAYPKKVFGR